MTEALLEQPTELSTLNQPVDLFELERQRHFNLANSVVLAMTEGFGDTVDSREFMYDDPSFGSGRVGQAIAYTSRNDRDDGKYLPIFQNGMELSAIRAEARNITAMSGGIMGAIGTLTNYTFGAGFTFAAQRAADCPAGVPTETTDALSLEAQQIINLFLLQNKFQSDMDREIDWRAREDGEVFVEVYQSPAGQIRASFCEPDAVCEPANPSQLDEWLQDQDPTRYSNEWLWSWSFGVHGIRRCPDDPQGFHVVYDQSGEDWEYVPSSRMLHIKRNVPRNVKRGVSDLYWVANDVLRETKIRRNTADAAALQAAIAWIRQHAKGTTPAAVQTMVTGQTVPGQPQRATPGTSTTKRGKLNAGTVLDIPEGQEYLPGPMGAERNANFILIAQYVNRAIATRWAMPEFMFTSDASNSNFASTLVAESPFVKAREADQRFYGASFVELLWKVLRMAHELGRFARGVKVFEDLMKILDVTATGPRVAIRDELQTVQRQQIEMAMGTLSPESAAAEMGRKLKEEQEKGARSQTVTGSPITTTATAGTGSLADPLAVDVASTAMNGAQVASLVDVISQVTLGTLPAESAIQAVVLAFPTISMEQARAMVNPAAAQSGVAPTVGPNGEPLPGGATPAAPPSAGAFVGAKRSDFTNNMKATNDVLQSFIGGTSEVLTLASLKRLGWSDTDAADLVKDARDGKIDTAEVAAATEEIDPALDVTAEKKPGRGFPGGVPTQQSIQDDAAAKLGVLFDQLAVALEHKAGKSTLVSILEQIEEVKGQAAHAAHVLGMLTPFKPAIQDAPSAEAAPVTPLAAVATVTE